MMISPGFWGEHSKKSLSCHQPVWMSEDFVQVSFLKNASLFTMTLVTQTHRGILTHQITQRLSFTPPHVWCHKTAAAQKESNKAQDTETSSGVGSWFFGTLILGGGFFAKRFSVGQKDTKSIPL